MKKLYDALKRRYNAWKDRRFLKKHGCENWKQYYRRYDPDYNYRANRIVDYYHGYSYVYCFENHDHFAYTEVFNHGPGGVRYGNDDIEDWCTENLTDKFRGDFHRVFRQTSIGNNGVEESEWWINDIGGGDYMFIAFKSEQDYIHFLLRWK